MSYTGFELDQNTISKLMSKFPPRYPNVYVHHVTFCMGRNVALLQTNPLIKAYGYVTDGESIEAILVTVNGNFNRPDGRKYHITMSLDKEKGRKPVHSNDLIEANDFLPIDSLLINGNMRIMD